MKRKLPQGTRSKAQELFKSGKSSEEIAKSLGVNVSTVRRWRADENALAPKVLPARPMQILPLAPETNPQLAPRMDHPAPVVPAPVVPAPAAAPLAAVPVAPVVEELSLEELAEIQQLIEDASDWRKDYILDLADREGLNAQHPKILSLAKPSRVGKIALKRGAKSIAPLLARIPPWAWLIVGLALEGGSMIVATMQLKKLGAEVKAAQKEKEDKDKPPKKPHPENDSSNDEEGS